MTPRVAPKVLGRVLRFAEALDLPARWLGSLPLAPSLALHVPKVPGVVRVEFDPALARAARRGADIVLDAHEWRALVLGVEADRLWPADLAALCSRKRSEPAWRIEPEAALAGAQPVSCEPWTVRQVLERADAHVLSIELG